MFHCTSVNLLSMFRDINCGRKWSECHGHSMYLCIQYNIRTDRVLSWTYILCKGTYDCCLAWERSVLFVWMCGWCFFMSDSLDRPGYNEIPGAECMLPMKQQMWLDLLGLFFLHSSWQSRHSAGRRMTDRWEGHRCRAGAEGVPSNSLITATKKDSNIPQLTLFCWQW